MGFPCALLLCLLHSPLSALHPRCDRLIDFYVVMGNYDYVIIGEVPSDEVALARLLSVGMAGDVRTKTLRAFTRDEFARVVQQLP